MKNLLIAIAIVLVLVGGYFGVMNILLGNDAESNDPYSAGKLDINVVCESALSYMSFPDGEATARFVAECKEGKHPQVIERYKADNNLGDGAAI